MSQNTVILNSCHLKFSLVVKVKAASRSIAAAINIRVLAFVLYYS
jgi:hypothetical protein